MSMATKPKATFEKQKRESQCKLNNSMKILNKNNSIYLPQCIINLKSYINKQLCKKQVNKTFQHIFQVESSHKT